MKLKAFAIILLITVTALDMVTGFMVIGSGPLDTRNFDNFQQGRTNIIVLNNTQAVESSFIRFPRAYSSLPNMTLQTTNASQSGAGIGLEFITILSGFQLLNNTVQIPMVVTSGFTAPTWVVPNAVTEIFGNTQDRQSSDLDTVINTFYVFYFSVNVISVLPVGDNGKIWFQFSTDNGGTWQNLPSLTCAVAGLSLRTSGIQTFVFPGSQQQVSITLTSKTLFRIVGCSGNGVGSATIGGVWITVTELIPVGVLNLAFTETATPILEVVNESLIGFNIELYFPQVVSTIFNGSFIAELTVNIQWTAWLTSKTCTADC